MSAAICWAARDDGALCRQPAVGIDYDRGCTVCATHLQEYLDRVEGLPEPGAPYSNDMKEIVG